MKKISNLRAIVSMFFFSLVMGLFLMPEIFSQWSPVKLFCYVQFIPSAVRFIVNSALLAGSGFLLVLVFTVFFGRVYCSFCCPLGYIQDFFIWVSGYRKKNNRFFKGYGKTRYFVFSLFLVSLLLGSPVLIQILDPFSLAGKIVHGVVVPFNEILRSIHLHGTTVLQEGFKNFEKQVRFSRELYIFTSFFLVMIMFFSMKRGRLYCNVFCPVGMILGLLAQNSRYRFKIDKEGCVKCKKCEMVCPAGCIDSKNNTIHMIRCVSCFECKDICPESAIEFSRSEKGYTEPVKNKRLFMISSLLSVFSFACLNGKGKISPGENRIGNACVIPPGSGNINRYASSCTACNLCVEVCYPGVLNPVYMRHGLKAVFVPVLDFSRGKCAYECNLCSQICPSGAILPVALEEKKQIQIGQVELIKEKCVAYTSKKDCGACAEVCPTHAVYTERRNGIRYPEINVKSCVGCGACEHVCPVNPKAIIVRGNTVHRTADKPWYPKAETKEGKLFKPEGDFPF